MRVAIIPLSAITVGKRFREDLGDVKGLAESIRTKGLITPLAVSLAVDSSGKEVFNLLAGGRRYEASRLAGLEELPVRIYDRNVDELELRSIELEENVQRKDLEWIEHVNLQREIHRLQQQIHGPKLSTAVDATGWSMRDTARLLGRSLGSVSTDVKLADAVEQMPDAEWEACKTKNDAMKLLNRIEEVSIRKELARRAAVTMAGETTATGIDARRQRLVRSYIVGDFFEKASRLESGTFNFVEIDPPYGIDLGHMKKKDGISRYEYSAEGYNEVEATDYYTFITGVLRECHRVMAENSWLVLWFAPEPWFETMHKLLVENGFETSRLCGLWVKPTSQTMNPSYRLANSYEMFFYAWKGRPALARPGSSNVFQFSQVNSQKKIHPTERPVELMESIISTFAFPNSKILVPFAGSGATLVAAQKLGMHAIGYDLSQQFHDSFVSQAMTIEL